MNKIKYTIDIQRRGTGKSKYFNEIGSIIELLITLYFTLILVNLLPPKRLLN